MPQLPDSDGDDCFCQGAIIDHVRAVDPNEQHMLATGWLDIGPRTTSIGMSTADISSEPPHHFPPFSTGRDICALTSALLL